MSAWRRWVAWIDRREPVVGLAGLRLLTGAILFHELFSSWWRGVDHAVWRQPADGGWVPLTSHWRWDLFGGPTPAVIDGTLFAGMAASVLVAVGLGTRAAAFVALQSFLALIWVNPPCGGGHDKLISNALWILALSPAGKSWSLEAKLGTGRWVDPTPRPSWPRRVLGLQIVLCYAFAGLAKMAPEWWPWGRWEAVYYAVLQPQWNELDTTWAGALFPLTQLATVLTMFFELLFPLVPLWMWGRHRYPSWRGVDVRFLFLGLGFGMHAVLETFMDLGPFAKISVAYYLVLFDADEYAALARRVRGAFGRHRATTEGTTA